MKITPEARDVQTLRTAFMQMPDVAARELHAFMVRTTAHLQTEVQERTPTTHGTLRASIFGEVRAFDAGFGVEGLVGTTLAYAPAVELGTKPHFPPIEPLVDWARQKLALSGTEARRAAHAIARKIARKGTTGAFMFRDTFNENRAQVLDEFGRMANRLAASMGRL